MGLIVVSCYLNGAEFKVKACFFHFISIIYSCQAVDAYLLIEFVDDSLRPLQVKLLTLQRSVDISQLDAHLTHQQSIVFIGPVNTWHAVISHLERRAQLT